MHPREDPQAVLAELLEGNRRFFEGRSIHQQYSRAQLSQIAGNPRLPRAAIIACSDSRVAPEVIFDQPLGSLFVSRVPGNVSCDSVRWMLEIAVEEFNVPLVLVVGHTRCLAVGQVASGVSSGSGGLLRSSVSSAVFRAWAKPHDDLTKQSIIENALQAVEHLIRDYYRLASAVRSGDIHCQAALYHVETGQTELLLEDEKRS